MTFSVHVVIIDTTPPRFIHWVWCAEQRRALCPADFSFFLYISFVLQMGNEGHCWDPVTTITEFESFHKGPRTEFLTIFREEVRMNVYAQNESKCTAERHFVEKTPQDVKTGRLYGLF